MENKNESKGSSPLTKKDDNTKQFQIEQVTEYFLNATPLIIDLVRIIIDYVCYELLIRGQLRKNIKINNIMSGLCTSISVISDGTYIYFSSTQTHKIHMISAEGNNIKSIGRPGGNDGEFCYPRGLFINGTYLYVADRENCRVQLFSIPNGNFIKKIQFRDLCNGVNIYRSLLYVNFYLRSIIGEHTLDGTLMREINYGPITDWTCTYFCIFDNYIYMTCALSEITCMSFDGDMYIINGKDNGGELFEGTTCVLVTNNSLYIADYHKIQQFDRINNNTFVKVIGKGICHGIQGMAFINDKLYVFDVSDSCIYIFC